jgi:hypothetical protein
MTHPPPPSSRSWLIWCCLALLLPVLLGVGWFYLPALGSPIQLLKSRGTSYPPSERSFREESLGELTPEPAWITHVKIAALEPGTADVLACDARRGRVLRYRQKEGGGWQEEVLGDRDLLAPCGATVVDLDGDSDLDIVVPVLGSVFPTDERIGSVVLLENDGQQRFTTRVLLEDVRRVSDVQAGDLDGDGDLDLAVAEFGYDHGGIWWLENRGELAFSEHLLLGLPGCIHVPLADFDGDGDLDLAALLSQEAEQVVVFENRDGKLHLRNQPLFRSDNFDFGASGLVLADLNQDGKQDLLLSAGDNLEIDYPAPQAWHGCYWLENRGDWQFAAKRISNLAGTYDAAADDVDGDGDQDVTLASMFNDWRTPGTASCIWLENDGRQNFSPWQISEQPTHLASITCGDLDGDGRSEIVAGALHLQQPFNRPGRILLWQAEKGSSQ